MGSIAITARADTTALKQPKELFVFDRDENGKWGTDAEEARRRVPYYYLPDLLLEQKPDLAAGIGTFRKIPEELNRADFHAFLAALQRHEQQIGARTKADIVTFRGIMTKLVTLPYDPQPFCLYIVPFDGQLFIKIDDSLQTRNPVSEKQQLHMDTCEYGGYKFETLATLPKKWGECLRTEIEQRHEKTVSNYSQYISVVRSGVGKVKTVLAGEVDCVWDYLPESGQPKHYAELKTSRIVTNPNQAVTFEKKLFKTWAQCFLLGISKVVYGFRNDDYLLENVEVFTTDEIPVLLKENKIPRKSAPILCTQSLKWYGAVLEWLSKIDRLEEKAFRLEFKQGDSKLTLSEVPEQNETLRKEIFPEGFVAWRRNLPTDV